MLTGILGGRSHIFEVICFVSSRAEKDSKSNSHSNSSSHSYKHHHDPLRQPQQQQPEQQQQRRRPPPWWLSRSQSKTILLRFQLPGGLDFHGQTDAGDEWLGVTWWALDVADIVATCNVIQGSSAKQFCEACEAMTSTLVMIGSQKSTSLDQNYSKMLCQKGWKWPSSLPRWNNGAIPSNILDGGELAFFFCCV